MVYSEDLLERLRYEYEPSTHQIEVLACLSLMAPLSMATAPLWPFLFTLTLILPSSHCIYLYDVINGIQELKICSSHADSLHHSLSIATLTLKLYHCFECLISLPTVQNSDNSVLSGECC